MSLPYNIYSALRSAITQPTPGIPDIDSTLTQALGKAFYPTDKDKLKKAPRTMRELHKLDDLGPDKQGYLNALQSELDSLRTMNVYNSSDNLNILMSLNINSAKSFILVVRSININLD